MAEVIRPMRQKTGTAAQWASANPVLNVGEPGLDTTNRVRKTGDGVRTWAQLSAEKIGDAAWSVSDALTTNVASISGSTWFQANGYNTTPIRVNANLCVRDGYTPGDDQWGDAAVYRSRCPSQAQKAQLEVVTLSTSTGTVGAMRGTPPAAVLLRSGIVRLPDLTTIYGLNNANYIDSVGVPVALFAGVTANNWYVYQSALGRKAGAVVTDMGPVSHCIARGPNNLTLTGGGIVAAQITADNILTLSYKGTTLWSDEVPSAPTGEYAGFTPGANNTTVRNFAASNL